MNGWEAESDAAQLLNGLGIETEIHYAIYGRFNRKPESQSSACTGII